MFAFSVGVPSTSAIPDYPTLKTTVADWLDRDDLDSKIPMFVQMCEAMFNRDLRTPEMEAQTQLVATSGTIAFPADYLAMRALWIEGSPERPLRGMAPTAIWEEFDGTADIPVAYCLVAGALMLVPPPSSATTLNLTYFSRIEGLSDGNESNWLLEKHPDAYLYGTLYNAEMYLDNATRAAQWKGLLDGLIVDVNASAQDDRFGAGPLVPNTVVQVNNGVC